MTENSFVSKSGQKTKKKKHEGGRYIAKSNKNRRKKQVVRVRVGNIAKRNKISKKIKHVYSSFLKQNK